MNEKKLMAALSAIVHELVFDVKDPNELFLAQGKARMLIAIMNSEGIKWDFCFDLRATNLPA